MKCIKSIMRRTRSILRKILYLYLAVCFIAVVPAYIIIDIADGDVAIMMMCNIAWTTLVASLLGGYLIHRLDNRR